MGGRGSGGRRIGAGRKRKDNVLAFQHGSRQRAGQAPEAPAMPVPVEPPPGIRDAERAVWERHAPDAIRAGTLTAGTAHSFVQLVCEPRVIYDRILAAIDRDGLTFQQETETGTVLKKHPLITDLNNWHRRVDNGHKEFALAPMGKPVAAIEKPADPFAEFEAHA